MNRRAFRLIPLALILATAGLVAAPVTAHAAPIDDKQAQADRLEAQINANAERLAALNEQINGLQLELDHANDAIVNADALVAAAQEKTKELRAEVAHRAAAVYARGGSQGVDDLDVANAQDLASRQKYTSLAAQRDKQIVNALARAKDQVASLKSDAENARAAAQAKKDEIETQKADLAKGDAQLQGLYSQVKGEIADLVRKAEEERRAREAAEAQSRIEAARVARLVSSRASSGPPPPPSERAGAAVAYAQAQVGKPYCNAGAGPTCFDCSGLTMMAWAQAGVTMPHGSYAQNAMFPSVPLDQLQPGDLIFWPGHVAISLGGSMMIHAPHTGEFVEVVPIYGSPTGAVRPG
ncbi:MAG TPA: NlpC/P60 family protein [Acidimicrobiia bacterium]